MKTLQLNIRLLSDTTFGRGNGVAGVVDQEVEHDPKTGLPFVRGRTLKGLLVEACADILFSLKEVPAPGFQQFEAAAQAMFGQGGSQADTTAKLIVGTGLLSDAVYAHIKQHQPSPTSVLESLTTIRYQTAVDANTGSPEDGSLRASRAVIRDRVFCTPLMLDQDDETSMALLVACAAQVRRGGSGRGRGRGRLEAALWLFEDDGWHAVDTDAWLTTFEAIARRSK